MKHMRAHEELHMDYKPRVWEPFSSWKVF
jgi:hypothetical protein